MEQSMNVETEMDQSKSEETVTFPKSFVMEVMLGAQSELKRQQRNRYVGYGIKVIFVVLFIITALGIGGTGFAGSKGGDIHKPHVAFVELYGPIMPGQVDVDKIIPALSKAFENKFSKVVVLRANSPGGSPTQASIIFDEIKLLQKRFPEKKLYVSVEDLCASACYWIISAADKIFVDKTSMIGSIGVITSGFGFSEVMKKVGVEHRVITAGENKNLLDPFSPENPYVTNYWKSLLADIHKQFISTIEGGRGNRLKKDYPDLYTGLIWNGEKSVEIGLSDDIGSLMSISREAIGEVNTVNYTPSPDLFKQLAARASVEMDSLRAQAFTPKLF